MSTPAFVTARNAAFPKAIVHAAQASERVTGTPTCVTLAQWALESAWGRALSGANNPFGIKGNRLNGKPVRTWEVVNGKNIMTTAYFRNFASMQAAFEYHGRMLANPLGYYRKARAFYHTQPSGKTNWRAYVKSIAPIYATDPAYASKIIGIIDRFHLYDFNLKGSAPNV